ncbi:MAG: hypothetical protein M1483_01055 [Actinobacteria bacterium]|jgi:hypothetical protein|nr:hypothetical protein [Actinomycetota bacterium]
MKQRSFAIIYGNVRLGKPLKNEVHTVIEALRFRLNNEVAEIGVYLNSCGKIKDCRRQLDCSFYS